MFGSGVAKSVCTHAKVKFYQKKMRTEKRCGKCVSPWHSGTCACGKWGSEQIEIESLVNRLLGEGWKR